MKFTLFNTYINSALEPSPHLCALSGNEKMSQKMSALCHPLGKFKFNSRKYAHFSMFKIEMSQKYSIISIYYKQKLWYF